MSYTKRKMVKQEHVYLKELFLYWYSILMCLCPAEALAIGSWRVHISDFYSLFEEEAVVVENFSIFKLFVSVE